MSSSKIKPSRSDQKKPAHPHDPGHEKSRRAIPALDPALGAEYFESVARATNDAIRDWDVKTGTLAWPRGLESLLGHSATDAGKIGFWLEHIHPEDLPSVQESLRETFAGQSENWAIEYRFQRADGEYVDILDRALILRDASGAAVRTVCSMMDVTARKQLQAQAAHSQRMEAFGQLAGGVAHDFNNFLTTILGYSDLILSANAVKGAVTSQIAEIRDAAGRASGLTNQLLAFSRRQALEPDVLEINAFISKLEESILHLLGENISVVPELHDLKEGAHVRADPGQLTQIMLNLAVNARDAMRNGGRLTIATAVVRTNEDETIHGCELSAGEFVHISVRDNGGGMTDEVMERLFEPFFTTKNSRQRSGLGLATSYGIVRQSGGQICAESVLGKGTTFHIFLPRVEAPPPPAYKRRGQAQTPTGTEKILVLEDDVSVRHLAVRVLRGLGYDVVEAASAADATSSLGEKGAQQIDLLLTDLVLPKMSGRDFADWLRRANPKTKVIFVSGYLDESLQPKNRRDPKMTFLPKPFTAGQLGGKIREVLDAVED
ncbi:MAG TPA: ATP-binding protein [Chthoniobacterales bacterium]